MNVLEHAQVSVVIPAHNEGRAISSLLAALGGGRAVGVELIVVCNGCTDDTARRAREVGPNIVVLELPRPSKREAIAAGDAVARYGCRAWIDADVLVSLEDLRRLVAALAGPIQVAAPVRNLDLQNSSWLVRWYYDVWQELPQVRSGVFGRGVVVMTPAGHSRASSRPHVMSDDLAVSEEFGEFERRVVPEASVVISGPTNIRDLLRRRVRVYTGNAQMDQLGMRTEGSKTTVSSLLRIARSGWLMPLKVLAFASVALIASRYASRAVKRGDFSTWLRDESSRA